MKTNCSITLYNKYTEKSTQKTLYKKTVIKKINAITGANWQGQPFVATVNSAESSKGVVNIVSSINVFIPMINNLSGKSYIDPIAWRGLADIDRDKYFTFQEQDYIAKGECDFKDNANMNEIPSLSKTKDNVITIMSAIVNDNGSPRMRHFMIGGK